MANQTETNGKLIQSYGEGFAVRFDASESVYPWLVTEGDDVSDYFAYRTEAHKAAKAAAAEAESERLVDQITWVLSDASLETLRKIADLLGPDA